MRIATLLSPAAGVILLLTSAMASADCASLRDEIAEKIEANGVPANQYTLSIEALSDSGQTRGEIVGHCENNSRQVIYTRHAPIPMSPAADKMTDSSPVNTPGTDASADHDSHRDATRVAPSEAPEDDHSESESYNPIEERLHDLRS